MISSILPDIASSKERALETASMIQLQVPIGAAISVGISGQQKADFRPDHRLDSGTCISSHGTDQLETQCTISQL